MPAGRFALTGVKADERKTPLGLLAAEPGLTAARPGQTLIGDRNYFGRDVERQVAEQDIRLLWPARKREPERPGAPLFKPLRQVTESVNETFKGQLHLERHRGRTQGGVIARIMQRIPRRSRAQLGENTTEMGGIGTLPVARRQGLGAAVMAALVAHARDRGVRTVFLAYAEEAVARIYARLGFRLAGTTLLIANQPARGQ